jgi:hypothetical protein
MQQPTTIDAGEIDFLLSLNAAFGQTETYIQITRIPAPPGECYRPLTLLPQAIDCLCTQPQRPSH